MNPKSSRSSNNARRTNAGRSKSKLNQQKTTSLRRSITKKQTIGKLGLPDNKLTRLIQRYDPKHLYHYWWSKKGGIMALKVIGLGLIGGFVLLYVLLAIYDGRANLGANNPSHAGNLTIYDDSGTQLIYSEPPSKSTTQENLTSLKQSSPYIQDASIAIEDKNFYHENGVDVLAILRSAVHDASSLGKNNIGGSTITEQTVKLDDLKVSDQRSLYAKFAEFFIAIDTNRKYTKQAILTHYLNIAPYGDCNGVEAASQQYFGINANQLTIAESALLASIPKDPTYYAPSSANPYFDRQATTARMDYIMQLMYQQHYISKAKYQSALKEDPIDLALSQKPIPPTVNLYPNFSDAVIKEVSYDQTLSPSNPRYINPSINIYGLKIISTINVSQQQFVDSAFQTNTTKHIYFPGAGASENIFVNHLDDESFVAENVPTGQITALVGSFDESNPSDTSNFDIVPGSTYTSKGVEYGVSARNGQTVAIDSFNSLDCATNQACVQPGSSFKLYDYSAVISDTAANNGNGVGAGSVLYDSPGLITCTTQCTNPNTPTNLGWACGQSSHNNCLQDDTGPAEMYGPITLRYAIGNSLNIPAVKTGAIAGQDSNGVWKAIDVADNMMGTNFVNGNKINDYVCIANNPATGQPETLSNGDYVYNAKACSSGEPLIGDQAQVSLIDHVNGYATAARLGAEMPYTTILKIINPYNNKTLFSYTKPKATQVISNQTEYIMMNMLSDHNASFMSSLLKDNTGWDISYKSGTQFEQYNGLVMAASTQYAVGMWVGCPDHCVQNPTCNDGTSQAPIDLPCGSTQQMEYMTVPVVKSFMLNVLKNIPVKNWTVPTGIQTLPAYCQPKRINSDVPPSNCSNYTDIYPSWYKQPQTGKGGTYDKVSGYLATSCTPALAKVQINASSDVNVFSIDPFYGKTITGSTSTVSLYSSSQADNIHLCSDSMPSISISSPPSCTSGTCDFGIVVQQGTHPLTSNQFPVQINAIVSGTSYPASCTFNPTMDPNNSPAEANGSCTFSYSTQGTATMTAQVIDSVLYSTESSPPVSFTVNAPTFTVNTSPVTGHGNNQSEVVSWTINGSDTYSSCTVGTNSYPSSPSGDRCTITGLSAGTYTVTVTDNTDGAVGTAQFTFQ
ncbi:MAG TPA: transglycosylase domain-containing protein [Candidatus Saccharimonadia bacterium]|nr:transglycosylase domain-containing protein [Candidatus Saccharimonadia bacterium]